MSKRKPGKKKEQRKVKKAAPRKVARRQAPKASPAQQPQAAQQQHEEKVAPKAPPEYPWNVIVHKGEEKLPVTVTDPDHYARLCEQFGAAHVEVSK